MAPGSPNERIAYLEATVADLKKDADDYRVWKESMIAQFSELRADLKMLSWKVSVFTGIVVALGNHLASWGFGKFLK